MKLKHAFVISALMICISAKSQITPIEIPTNQHQTLLPYNRIVQSAGMQIYFGDKSLENHALDVVLSPDRNWIAVEERYSIVFISTVDKQIKCILDLAAHGDLAGRMNTYSGIIWHKGSNGLEVFWSTIGKGGRSYVVSASWDGEKAVFRRLIEYKTQPPARYALPNEILIRQEESKEYLYVVLNGTNKVIKQDFITGDTIWTANPGVAPYGLAAASGKLYVTLWAGRTPEAGDKDVAGVPWGKARVDNINAGGATREGSVAVIDIKSGKIIKDIIVGLHPNDIISDKTGKFIYVSNSNSDNISVINTSTDEISETISVRLQPEINPYFGDSPNGLALSPNGKTLYAANGMDNALAVIKLGKNSTVKASEINSRVTGFIPTGAYPSAISANYPDYLYVANIEAANKCFWE
jgi:YVTN family beta-propeller protein